MNNKKLIVVGGGAAGFFTAINAARLNPTLQVTILEKTSKFLGKVKVSGGGRCNVTHACFDIQEMYKKYPRGGMFVRKAFHQFFTTDTIEWFKERGVTLKTEDDGRMFPDTDSSQTIIDCLLREADKYKVEIKTESEVKSFQKKDDQFQVTLQNNEQLISDYLCVASGGYPQSSQFNWLKEIGHSIEEPVPSLFTFNSPNNQMTQLMGVSVADAKVKIAGTKLTERGPVLITHWGLSGPAVIRLSAWGAREFAEKNWQFKAVVNWLPEWEENSLREKMQEYRANEPKLKMKNKNPFYVPQRLWDFLLELSGAAPDMLWGAFPVKEQNKLVLNLSQFELPVSGKTTFKEEFVTAGGIKLSEVDANTMMSKIVPNLFFAGEILDVDGVTGGFNFQHAWTSGFIAAKSIATR